MEQAHLDAVAAGRCGTWLLDGLSGTDRALGPFYAHSGLTVLPPGRTTSIGYVLTGRPIGLGAGPGEQLFHRWNRT
ncbi:hypothetical protein [Streptomyces radiopugnans]|uniref:Uncharacterized protein n=1 Tax=Streptomyces radiopugnans TaxID=403935 RepID=A0A1H9KL42_9ACTN|nr:hypothetical protein [Streptomyces radiopugnans]SEQ99818.1 hypothetical protein SAMN05216481_12526 [Streptomyces radiopugnans]